MRPELSYLICSTQRTASTLLCQMLTDTGIAGAPDEFFFYILNAPRPPWNEWLRDPTNIDIFYKQMEDYTTTNGVFGANIMWRHFNYMTYQLRQLPIDQSLEVDQLLAETFANPCYIWTTRQNKVRQAVSLWRAQQTGVWLSGRQSLLSPFWTTTPKFSYERIDALVQEIQADENSWKWFFDYHDIQPLVVVYEEFVSAPVQTLQEVLEYLDLSVPASTVLPTPRLKRQADGLTEEWIQKYHERKQSEKTI